MLIKRLFSISLLFLFIFLSLSVYPEQRIENFYLSNLKEDGTRDWEVNGDEAIISDDYVDIDKMRANYYLEEDTVLITSNEARMNKENMDVFLKDDVHIENEDGATLDTDSLNWQRRNNHIETFDRVKTSKDTMQVTATGLSADTQLNNAAFGEDVEVTFADEKTGDVTVAVCSGPLEIEYGAGKATFNDDVVVTNSQGKLYSDKATLYFDTEEKKLIKIISEGNVKIIRENNVTFSQKATYLGIEQKIILEGKPRIMYFPQEGEEVKFPF
tara:strand:+ start:135 stop:947 length:813 start_codon:yes stop_codon:yes gene_type:complete